MKSLAPHLTLALTVLLSISAKAAQYNQSSYSNNSEYTQMSEDEIMRRRLMTEDSYEAPKGQLFDEYKYLAGQTLLSDYDNVIVINKAAKGPTAQTLRFYSNRKLVLTTKVSTGREDLEKVGAISGFFRQLPFIKGPTNSHWRHTTRGFYTVKRVEGAAYQSSENSFHMPYAMFFNDKRGLAVHQVPPDLSGGERAGENALGNRASSGCVRVHKNYIRQINFTVLNSGQGQTPVLDSRTGQGVLDENGQVKTQTGWKTIVIVEEY